jgi:N-acyl-D-aspartate/D-glutamate deacylase
VLDARGLVVAPGFIDIHSHSDFTLLADPRAVSAIAQGVTTEVIGNCGFGCAPLGGPAPPGLNVYGHRAEPPMDWRDTAGYFARLEAARPAVNVAALVPNGKLRLAVVGAEERPARPEERRAMARLLAEGLEAGAFGLSTGLEYGPERGCAEDEIVELCRQASRAGGLYATHTRNEQGRAAEAIAEATRVAEAAGAALQISHISSVARLEADSRRAMEVALAQVEAARRRGLDVGYDMHTRLFGTTTLSAALPAWAAALPPPELAAALASPALRDELHARPTIVMRLARSGWERVLLLGCRARPEWSGRSLAEVAAELRLAPLDAVLAVLRAEAAEIHRPMIAAFVYDESDARLAFEQPGCMVGSDATTLCPDGPLADAVFHGAYTWAAWFYRRFARELGALTPEAAVHRLTGLPARRLRLRDRGGVRPGARGDLAIFDPATFGERGSLAEPNLPAAGMAHVLVNGVVTMRDGALTGARAGRVLRRQEEVSV